jgi:cell volume regulation protein A
MDPVDITESTAFGILVVAAVVVVAVLSNRISERTRVPAPLLFLVGAAAASDLVPSLDAKVPVELVERVVTVALVVVLFDGGLGIGWRRFRRAAVPIATLGLLGTLLTTAGPARSWRASRAPTTRWASR